MIPKKSDIIERAFELHHQKNRNVSSANPEIEEVKESGFYEQAKDELMRSEGNLFLDHLEKEANSLGYELVKNKNVKRYSEDLEDFPISQIMREGCFVCGSRGSGKSNLLKILTIQALKSGVKVKVVDPSLTWKAFGLPIVKIRRKVTAECGINQVYDVSRLSVLEMREFVSLSMAKDLQEAIVLTDVGKRVPLLYVLEESQNLIMPNSLRTLRFQELSRFVTQGRNFGLSYVCSTQRLASTDVNLIEVSGVRYWGKLEGENSLRKARAWLPKFVVWRLRDLDVGSHYLHIGSKIKLLRLPLFKEAQKVVV